MKTSDFSFYLPKEQIAQTPLPDRAASRLLALDRVTGEIRHDTFRGITKYLRAGDCLVINDTKVMPARLLGVKAGGSARVEVLLLKRLSTDRWEVLTYPGKKARPGSVISFGEGKLTGEIKEIIGDGNRIIEFRYDGFFENILDELGEMPLPPYITEKLQDRDRYQTVYAKNDGSAAAPTAGLHFTRELLDEIEKMGVTVAHITLHVGLGTFRPVKVQDVSKHIMHSEYYVVEPAEAEKINAAKKNGGRIAAVGTTSMRTLESVADENGSVVPKSGWTDIFIYPGYKFKAVDILITNFHLPESTLIMLVSAFAGKENILRAYAEAVEEGYRFFSFGDAMVIAGLPPIGRD